MILEASTKALIQDKKNPMFLKPMHERETAHVAKTRTRCIDDLTKSRTQFESRHNAVAAGKISGRPLQRMHLRGPDRRRSPQAQRSY